MAKNTPSQRERENYSTEKSLSQKEKWNRKTEDTPSQRERGYCLPQVHERDHAFTLVELTLAVLILGIITAVGIPSFKSLWAKSEMQQASAHFAGALRYAQQRAVMERYPISIFVDVSDNTFWVPVEQAEEKRIYSTRRGKRSNSSSRRNLSRRNRTEYVKEIEGKLPEGFIFEFVYKVSTDDEVKRGEESFTFYPDGSADAAFFTLLRLADSREKERRIFVKTNPATGNVQIMEGKTEKEGSEFYKGYLDAPGLI